MPEPLLSKLESSRKELLDFSMRNSLLNHKQLVSRGVQIVREQSAALFRILVTDGKTMTFLPKDQPTSQTDANEETSSEVLEAEYNDNKLQTNETEASLSKRLNGTYYAARTNLEEQGVNVLYLALGMLHWYESDQSQEERQAPIVLIPVTLERSNVRERMKLKYSGEEIGENISLQAKMKLEFGIEIPEINDIEDFDISAYFQAVEKASQTQPRWCVARDEIHLGFFSFSKFLIYVDLDNAKWPEEKKPVEHPILQCLFDKGFQYHMPGPTEDAFIDTETSAGSYYQVIDADSSQILAMIAARGEKSLLIQGPPGTGKSQTITNLIADAVGQGKKVLFVAEKMAALEVVKRKLDSIGLGDICLELHSHKTNKRAMHADLIGTLALGRPNADKLEEGIKLLDKHREELNAYCHAVNALVSKARLTVHQVIGRLLQLEDVRQGHVLPAIDKAQLETWDPDIFRRAEALAERIQATLEKTGVPTALLFWGCTLRNLLPFEQDRLVSTYRVAATSIEKLVADVTAAADHFGIPAATDRKASERLLQLCRLAAASPDLDGVQVSSAEWLNSHQLVEQLLTDTSRLQDLFKQYETVLLPAAWTENVLETRRGLILHAKKWYKFLMADYNRAKKHLAALCQQERPKGESERLRYVDAILEAQKLKRAIDEGVSLATGLFTTRWQANRSNITELRAVANYLYKVHSAVHSGICPPVAISYLSQRHDPAISDKLAKALSTALENHAENVKAMLDALSFDQSRRFKNGALRDLAFQDQTDLIDKWIVNPTEIHKVIHWTTVQEVAKDERLAVLTDISVDWSPASRLLKAAIQKAWYEYLLEDTFRSTPSIRQFQRDNHEEMIQQFRNLDKLHLISNRTKVAMAHWEGLPGPDAGGQVNILKREFNKKSKLKPIRKVIEEAGLALQAIKPVFMMSPLSIANFLPPGAVEFDVVIFDEASQIKPVEALGAIIRGKQILVVGDSKQLPPTSFFDSLSEESEDEDNVTADIQSILGLCDAQGLPSRMLRWHYRSRHETLITLSNHEFYDNKLVIFPSPGSRQQVGLRFRHLKDTVYDRGKTRTNPKEAQRVAEAVMDHAIRFPNQTLGVVAFSSVQREAIDQALELLRKSNPNTENFFVRHPNEPFFVKNLENVQGDERDVIFISIGYGRTQEGYVSASFGPLNNDGGERRLNVLITRAKLRCEVFTNLTSDDIDLSRSRKRGVAALKNFLHYAEHKRLSLTDDTGLPADNPFEENVADKLTSLGYIVRPQLGSQGFFIDLAIVDPDYPGRYIIGIECDGRAYHSARSARDRDRLRQEVLENNGWRIHRIWSTDWFRHPEEELRRAVDAIEKAKEKLAIDDQEFNADQELEASNIAKRTSVLSDEINRDIKPKTGFIPPTYILAKLPNHLLQMDIHLYPVGQLAECVRQVVEIESPVHFEEMINRIKDTAGVAKAGSRIRDALVRAVSHLQLQKAILVKGDFLWRADLATARIRDRSNLPNSSRKIKFISPEEISLAICHVVEEALAISPDETAALVVRLFGFNRLTDEMNSEIGPLINKAIHDKTIQFEGGFLKPA